MRRFKDTLVGKGSALEAALAKSGSEAEKVYKATTERYKQLHNQEDHDWFAAQSNTRPTKEVTDSQTTDKC